MIEAKILVVDDEKLIRVWLEAHLAGKKRTVVTANSLATARSVFESESPDAVVLDLKLPDGNGLTLLREFVETDPEVAVIILSAHGDIATAVEAVKLGAYHFLEKPPQLETLETAIAKGLESRALKRTVSGLRKQVGWRFAGLEIVGQSEAIQKVVDLVEKVAASEWSTVLIGGESGVGKEVVAHAIHTRSSRAEAPILEVNCTALPETLLESELFGHEKGAFTDARERKKGLLELADGGTVLLDEIGDLPLASQAKLLRFLETRRFKRVGGIQDISVDVRVVVSSNRDLGLAVSGGSFREDLFYRINVIEVHIPPLRDRYEDIRPLAEHFLARINQTMRRSVRGFSEDAVSLLERYPWPGNARQLRNVVERAVILLDGNTILPEHLPEELQPGATSVRASPGFTLSPAGVDLQELECEVLRQALKLTGGNKSRAAELLHLSRDTLRYRMEKYGLTGPLRGEMK